MCYLRDDCIVLVYVDDCILIQRKGSPAVDALIHSLQTGPEGFKLEDEGSMDKFLGVNIDRNKDGSIEVSQPHLITRFLELIGIEDNENPKLLPAVKPLLHRDVNGPGRKYSWNYRTAVGMLTYLQGSTRPDISMAVHQCARFCNYPKLLHERAIRRIGKYLVGTREKGIIFKPDKGTGLQVFVDTDFAGG